MYNNIPLLFFDADTLVYRNACAAVKIHYKALFNGEDTGKVFDKKKDYTAFVKDQPESKQPFYSAEPIEHDRGVEAAFISMDKKIFNIRKQFGACKMFFYLTDEEKSNFRYDLATLLPYKAHRGERPKYFDDCRQHLIDHWDAEVVIGEEADDKVAQVQYPHYLALTQGESYSERDITAIVHVDKDINMVPGYHIHTDTLELYWIDEVTGWRNFYLQLITGDKQVDNIPGFYQLTGRKAMPKLKKPLEEMTDPAEMYEYVYALYDAYLPEEIPVLDEDGDVDMIPANTSDILLEIGNLLYMRREEGVSWTPPSKTQSAV